MSGKRYIEEFKTEAVKQVTDRNHSMTEVADRLGISYKSLMIGALGRRHSN